MDHVSRRAALAVCASALLSLTGCAGDRTADDAGSAGDYPAKDITLIVQAAAGGASDLTARTLAKELEQDLGRSIIVENRPGASGSIAMKYVASQKPDGYTIGYLPVEVSMLSHRGFDVEPADFALLGQVVNVPAVIVVKADSGIDTLADLIGRAKAAPGTVTVANSGPGSIWEAATTALGKTSGAQFKPVPFDGGAPAVGAVMGGKVAAAAAGVSEAAPGVKEGRLRALAVLDPTRSPLLPDVPTAKEAGADVVVGGWGGIGAPSGLDDAARSRLEAAIKKAAGSEAFTTTMTNAGAVPRYRSAAEFGTFANSEHDRFAGLLKPNGS